MHSAESVASGSQRAAAWGGDGHGARPVRLSRIEQRRAKPSNMVHGQVAASGLPNLFVVGSAKAGTTALYHYFKLHPQIFVPDVGQRNELHVILRAAGRRLNGPAR